MLIEEVSSKDEKPKDWWQKKNSNYDQFQQAQKSTSELKQAKDNAEEIKAQIEALQAEKKKLLADA